MPELPDIELYLHVLRGRVVGQVLKRLRVTSFSVLKTHTPPLSSVEGLSVRGLRRIGKRVVFELDGAVFIVLHLMISGRLHWKEVGAAIPRKVGHAAFDFAGGSLILTEASTKKRASIHLVEGEAALSEHDRGGIEVMDANLDEFSAAVRKENRTLKRCLTDQRLFSGIGNAYSDEILHRAGLSPVQRTGNLSDAAVADLRQATVEVLGEWRDRLIAETGEKWPAKVTAFRPEMAVHGKFKDPCPVCGTPVQRIVYAENEVNYCPGCQTGGKLLADRSLSRLLKDDWPRTVEELE